MYPVPAREKACFEAALESHVATGERRNAYRKWVRYFWDFCAKYQQPPGTAASVAAFCEKLACKGIKE